MPDGGSTIADRFQCRRLGAAGPAIPDFGFGGAHLGELYARLEESAAQEALREAWSLGIRYFDTAPWYGHGLSERRIGNFLIGADDPGFLLSTKVGRVYTRPRDPTAYSTAPWAGGLRYALRFDYGYDGVMRSYEDSLHRLGVARIDMLVIHDLDRSYHGDQAEFDRHWTDLAKGGMRALAELKAAGDILAIGAGINDRSMIARMAALGPDFVLVAMPYTLLDQGALDDGFPECRDHGVGVVVGAPLASGILATGAGAGGHYNYGAADPAILKKVGTIERVCQAHDVALPAAALQFPLGHPLVASVIPGAVSAAQVRENVGHFLSPIPSAFWSDLKSEGLVRADAPVPGIPA